MLLCLLLSRAADWSVAGGTAAAAPTASPCWDVTAFGAVGNGATDDTPAFQAAAAAAAPRGGCVRVPPVAHGGGYVLTSTVTLAPGVTLIGTLSGYSPPGWCYGAPLDSNSTGGSRILARPAPATYDTKAGTGAPLIHLTGTGCGVRGLNIVYDRAPFPTDAELFDPAGPYGYGSFEEARRRFVAEHVPPAGPAIYVTSGVRVEIADVVGSGWTWLVYFGGGGHGMSHVRRVQGWGFNSLVTLEQAADVMTFDQLRYTVNSGPYCLGARPASCDREPPSARCRGNFTAVPAIVALRPSNALLWLGRADGYVARDLFAFGAHTGVRLGVAPPPAAGTSSDGDDPYGGALALRNPVTGAYAAGAGGAPAPGTGPWGTVSQLLVDQAVFGIHLVWPNPLTNRFVAAQLHPSFWRKGDVVAGPLEGSGADLGTVGREAGVYVEPTHSVANNKGLLPTTMLSSMVVASFSDGGNYGEASASLGGSNGRAFVLLGDGLFDVRGFAMNNERNGLTHLWARARGGAAQLRVSSAVLNYSFAEDVLV